MNITLAKAKLKDVCKIEKGKIGITKAIEGEYPLVVTAEERSSHNEWHFDEPATIVPLVSSTGHGHASIKRLHYAEGKYAVGNILATLIPKDHKYLNAKYLYVYLTINKEKLLVSQMTGAANVSLTLTRLAEVEIEVPDYETQLKVIEKYEDAQRYKNSMSSQIDERSELMEKFRQQILQDAITGKLSEKWRKENSNIESAEVLLEKIKTEKEKLVKEGKMKKQKPLPPITENEIPFELPEGWVWCRMGEIFTTTSGGTPNRSDPDYWGGTVNWLKSGELNDGEILDESEEKITEIGLKNSSAKIFPKGSLLMAMYGATAGKLGFLTYDSATNQAVCCFYNNEKVSLKYLFTYLMSIRAKMIEDSWGQAQPNISQTYINRIVFPYPPLAEQHYIVERIESLFAKLDRIKELNIENQTNIDLLNQVVLRDMFSE